MPLCERTILGQRFLCARTWPVLAILLVATSCGTQPSGQTALSSDAPVDDIEFSLLYAYRPLLGGTLPNNNELWQIGFAAALLHGNSSGPVDEETRFAKAMTKLIKAPEDLIAFDNAERAIAASPDAGELISSTYDAVYSIYATAQSPTFPGLTPPKARAKNGGTAKSSGTTFVVYVNGVANTSRDFLGGRGLLLSAVRSVLPDAIVEGIYNRSAIDAETSLWGGRICPSVFFFLPGDWLPLRACQALGGIGVDAGEATQQLIAPLLGISPWGCEDIRRLEKRIRSHVYANGRVIVVPHSQGNLLTKLALDRLEPEVVGSVGVVSTGSPEPLPMSAAQFVRVSNCKDPIAALGGSPLFGCVSSDDAGGLPLYHSFQFAYMTGAARAAVLGAIVNMDDSLPSGGVKHPLAGQWTTINGEPGLGRTTHTYLSGAVDETTFTDTVEYVRTALAAPRDDISNCDPTPFKVSPPIYSEIPELTLNDSADPWSFSLAQTNYAKLTRPAGRSLTRFAIARDSYRYTYVKIDDDSCTTRTRTVSVDLNLDPHDPTKLHCVSSNLLQIEYKVACGTTAPGIETTRTLFEGILHRQ